MAPLLLIALTLAAAPPEAADEDRIVVTGHAWAPFISPMGEPFRAHSPTDNTLAKWFRQSDRNHDGVVTLDEMKADADRFFALLDSSGDGSIDPDELNHYEWEVAPDIQLGSRTRRPPGAVRPPAETTAKREKRNRDDGLVEPVQGAGRYALLDMPQPVAAADANFDRSITAAEFRNAATYRFQLLDGTRSGRLTLPALEQQLAEAQAKARKRKLRKGETDVRIGNPL